MTVQMKYLMTTDDIRQARRIGQRLHESPYVVVHKRSESFTLTRKKTGRQVKIPLEMPGAESAVLTLANNINMHDGGEDATETH